MESELENRPHSTPKPVAVPSTSSPKPEIRDETYSYSFNSTGESTRSLLSVLSHSSVESLSEHDIESDSEQHSSISNKDQQTSQSSNKSLDDNDVLQTSRTTVENPKLNVFEGWLVKKIKEERKAIKKELKNEEDARKLQEELENKKKERRTMIENRIEEWVVEHNTKERYKRQTKKKEEQMKLEIENKEKKRTTEREKLCREEWLAKKKEQQKLKATKEKEDREKKSKEKMERKEQSKTKYEEWYKNSVLKPRKVKNSYAYSEGTLKGYYDSGAYPTPSYYNPIPWKPLAIPRQTERNRSAKDKKDSKKKTLQEPSPPMLFKSRTAKESIVAFGRPR